MSADTRWRGCFTLLTAAWRLDELMRVTRYLKIRARLKPALAGRLVNDLREVAVMVEYPRREKETRFYEVHIVSDSWVRFGGRRASSTKRSPGNWRRFGEGGNVAVIRS